MEEQNAEQIILSFDTLFTTRELCLFKLAIPFLNDKTKYLLATYIKMQEFLYCYTLLSDTTYHEIGRHQGEFSTFYKLAYPYCNDLQKEYLSKIESFYKYKALLDQIMPFIQSFMGQKPDDLAKILQGFQTSAKTPSILTTFFANTMNPSQQEKINKFKKEFDQFHF